jgi:oligoribonuclease
MINLPHRTLWIDLETTGIEPETEQILEIGLVAADTDLSVIASRSIVIRPLIWPVMDDLVTEMHTRNGLLDDIDRRGVTQAEAEDQANHFADLWISGVDPVIHGGGSGIERFDLPFLRQHTPSFGERFHYRSVDVSGLKILMQHGAGITSERFYDRRATEGRFDGGDKDHPVEVILDSQGLDVAHRGVADALDALFIARTASELIRQGAR